MKAMVTKSVEDPPIITPHGFVSYEDDLDVYDELMNTYNELLKKYIKFEKSRKKDLESLKEKD